MDPVLLQTRPILSPATLSRPRDIAEEALTNKALALLKLDAIGSSLRESIKVDPSATDLHA